ncbi:MAG: GNAT family N-acetyltransferase [Muribaculaceae bacterium]|nr:GNAT family N-acetyltransferase [Muribaculaceae bacterium]
MEEYGFGLFAVEVKGEGGGFAGFVGFHRFCFEAPFSPGWEIGWRLSDRYWKRGYAVEAASACLEYARSRRLSDRVYSFTAVPNEASERVMRRIGMRPAGRFMHPALPDGHPLKEHVLYMIDLYS